MTFESHCIVLANGHTTMPGTPLAQTPLAASALRALAEFAPIADPERPPRVADLGCREGGFAIEFGRAGYDVLGIEARQSNVDRARWAVEGTGLANVSIACDDVRNLGAHGEFDVVFCCGLLYHLDEPVALLQKIGRLTRRLLILNTHYAEATPTPAFDLSEVTTSEGARGRWYRDLPTDAGPEEVERNRGASWGNEMSFWIDKLDLLEVVRGCGFPMVLEQYDFLGHIPTDARSWIEEQTRSQFLGVKPRA